MAELWESNHGMISCNIRFNRNLNGWEIESAYNMFGKKNKQNLRLSMEGIIKSHGVMGTKRKMEKDLEGRESCTLFCVLGGVETKK